MSQWIDGDLSVGGIASSFFPQGPHWEGLTGGRSHYESSSSEDEIEAKRGRREEKRKTPKDSKIMTSLVIQRWLKRELYRILPAQHKTTSDNADIIDSTLYGLFLIINASLFAGILWLFASFTIGRPKESRDEQPANWRLSTSPHPHALKSLTQSWRLHPSKCKTNSLLKVYHLFWIVHRRITGSIDWLLILEC